ncbi:MAG TPA: hypothetical protein VLT16_12005 [Candidatus Limnocylindrales bacterium]|nr:hypothetical protein [Candidatus Limnocylindrales bacterium]
MVSQCANPYCGTPFVYLRDGRLYAVPRRNPSAMIEYYWLCSSCASEMDLKFGPLGTEEQPTLVPRQNSGPVRRIA